MCGILGAYQVGQDIDKNLVRLSIKKIKNRGPDGEGFFYHQPSENNFLALAHTRLSIIDLSDAGKQPMVSHDGRYAITFNGEIYNYKELRSELKAYGFKFYSDSDTEVLLVAWQHWGKECLNRLEGMFAFAIFDNKTNQLTCVRDLFGIKPFFYFISNHSFYFASELDALFELSKHSKKMCYQRAYDYLVHGKYDNNELTFFDGIRHLMPGTILEINCSTNEVIPKISKWNNFNINEVDRLSFSEAAEILREKFLHNIKIHLRSDVPLGAALSGGIDSSAVVCAMRYLEPDAEINTFSYIAKGSPLSEEHWVDLVNSHVNAREHKVFADGNKLSSDFDNLVKVQGEPFSSTSIHANYSVFELAKQQGITVTLDGQGADELLGGYRGYPLERMDSLFQKGNYIDLLKFAYNWRKWPGRKSSEALQCLLGAISSSKYRENLKDIFLTNPQPDWLNPKIFDHINIGHAATESFSGNIKGRNVVAKMAHSLEIDGLPQLLRHADRNSMYFSIESRVPFLTAPMSRICLSLPEAYLISQQGETKSVFREAMRGIVPEVILRRKDKIGFLTPEASLIKSNINKFESIIKQGIQSDLFNKKKLIDKFNLEVHQNSISKETFRKLNFIRWCQFNNL